jgi:hypothetical protein
MIFGSTVLEVAMGMIFIYLLMSLLSSAISEYIESYLNNRGKNLYKGVELLLNDQTTTGKSSVDLADHLYRHGLIRALYRGADGRRLPSYIPSRTFALALWNMVSKGQAAEGGTATVAEIRTAINALPNYELKEALNALIDDAQGNFDEAIKNISEWFEAAMDRVSGWYKRKVQMILIVIGFVLALFLNADSINIAKALFQDDALRTAIVEQAENISPPATTQPAPQPTPTPANEQEAKEQREQAAKERQDREDAALQRVQDIRTQLGTTGLPLGWVATQVDANGNILNKNEPRRRPLMNEYQLWLLKILGLLITGFAVSQGAPFWFDTLNKFIVIRSTVKPGEKSGERRSKDVSDDDSDPTDVNNNTGTTPNKS